MVRRIPKPFTVEVGKGGRQAKAAAVSRPANPMMTDEQPRVSWPGLKDAPELGCPKWGHTQLYALCDAMFIAPWDRNRTPGE